MDVLTATIKRIQYIFEEFESVCLSVSGGKDSGILLYLFDKVAGEWGYKFDVLILDIEANYSETVAFLNRSMCLKNIREVYHFCLPFYEDNNSSIFQSQWMMWNPNEQEKWIHEMPKHAITISNMEKTLIPYFERAHGNPDSFLRLFSTWYKEKNNCDLVGIGVGIRTQESLNRYRAIHYGINKYKSKNWINKYKDGIYNFYPIYDWKVEDVWGAVSKYDFDYNHIYDHMLRLGVPLSEMRICQPFGLTQRRALNQFAELEPELWERLVNRVSGANFGSIYSKTSILGHVKTQKPAHLTWQQYAVFLLESYGFYSPLLRDHYYRKIKILMNYYKNKFQMDLEDIVEEASRKEWMDDEKLWHNWKGIARALEKNDFALTSRDYSLTRQDETELYALYDQYKDTLGIDQLNGKEYQHIVRELR